MGDLTKRQLGPRISAAFCCNDWRNGNFTGRVTNIELQVGNETGLELACEESYPSRCPEFRFDGDGEPSDKYIAISGKRFPASGYRTWVGNWCWDAVTMDAITAADLLNFLRSSGKWQAEGGIVRLGDQWESGEKFRPSDLLAAVMTDEELARRKAVRTEEAKGSPGVSDPQER